MGFKLSGLDTIGLGLPTYQRVYNWEVILPIVGTTNADIVSNRVVEFSFGEYSPSQLFSMAYGGYLYKYVNGVSIPNLSLTIYEKEDMLVSSYFRKWRELMFDEQGLYREKVNYAKIVTITYNGVSGDETLGVTLSGVFPVKMPLYRGSYRESGVLTYDVELNVDRIAVEGGGLKSRLIGKAKAMASRMVSSAIRRIF